MTALHHQTLAALARLHALADAEERRTVWRQAMATLGGAVLDQRPAPLEGLSPSDVQSTVRLAVSAGFLEDLEFLSPPARAACLYELSAALPPGPERTELERRTHRLLLDGDAATFAILATLLALGGSRALAGTAIRARVALCLDLPIGMGTRADAMALALISRRETVRGWLTEPSVGSLPARRLAARLLERAAREAARRHALGEAGAPRVFETPEVQAAWSRLLFDREPLVWRHVAAARGLLSLAHEELAIEVHRHTDRALSPTEWRRAAASLAASLAVSPKDGLKAALQFLRGPVFSSDPGIAAAMALGLPRAAEMEPEAVAELLGPLITKGGIDTFEALVDIRREHVGGGFDASAFSAAHDRLSTLVANDDGHDDGRTALCELLLEDLATVAREGADSLASRIDASVVRYAQGGAAAAFDDARAVLAYVSTTLDRLESLDDTSSDGRKGTFRALHELDTALLSRATLGSLLQLEKEKADEHLELLVAQDRIAKWLFAREGTPLAEGEAVTHPTYRLRRLRSWLHLVDAEPTSEAGSSQALHEETLASTRLLLTRVRKEAPSELSRITVAAAARASDALVREAFFEVSDAFLLCAFHAPSAESVRAFGEASVVPDVKAMLDAYAALRRVLDETPPTPGGRETLARVLQELVNTFPISGTPRLEALRQTLHALSHALAEVLAARSLAGLTEGAAGTAPMARLEAAVGGLARLSAGALRRLGTPPTTEEILAVSAIRELEFAATRARKGARDELEASITALPERLAGELPPYLGDTVVFLLGHALELPAEAAAGPASEAAPAVKPAALPPWLPPGRTLGSFHVLRVLGSGAVGSVFVAIRSEERGQEDPQRFALKVPEYAGAAARELSEQEFHSVFRQEAGALLALPDHPNLARLVTFDAGAKPKPILVMELVEGPSLDRVVRMRDMTVDRAFGLLEGISAGLDIMHQAGLGHLDLKPSNVILREHQVGSLDSPDGVPVLVDFGLAGRTVRAGCGTAEYGAPELWGAMGRGAKLRPMPVDVYALGCVIYELLTGATLFSAPSEIALVTMHISHDGNPPGLLALAQRPEHAALTELLGGMLRHKPEDRLTIQDVREKLLPVQVSLDGLAWPLA